MRDAGEGTEEGSPTAGLAAARCGGGGRLCAAEDLFIDLGCGDGADGGSSTGGGSDGGSGSGGSARYALHCHFGNEELGSMLRVELITAAQLVPLLEWCRAAPRRFTAAQAWRAAQGGGGGGGGAADGAVAEVPFAMVASVLGVLEWHGFCVRAPKASAQ